MTENTWVVELQVADILNGDAVKAIEVEVVNLEGSVEAGLMAADHFGASRVLSVRRA